MRGENVRNPELPPRYAAVHVVSEMRLALLATALVLLAACALLGLRLIPRPAAPALMDRALTTLLRGGFAAWLLPALTLALLIGGWWAFAHTSLGAERLTLELLLPTVSICSLTLGIVLQAARFHLNHRLASAGMAVGRKRLLVGLAWLLPLLAASYLIFEFHILTAVSNASLLTVGLVILWCFGKMGYGHVGRDQSGVRHRLLARLLLPSLLISTLACSLGALALVHVEARLVDRAFHTVTRTTVTPEARRDVEDWIAKWPK